MTRVPLLHDHSLSRPADDGKPDSGPQLGWSGADRAVRLAGGDDLLERVAHLAGKHATLLVQVAPVFEVKRHPGGGRITIRSFQHAKGDPPQSGRDAGGAVTLGFCDKAQCPTLRGTI